MYDTDRQFTFNRHPDKSGAHLYSVLNAEGKMLGWARRPRHSQQWAAQPGPALQGRLVAGRRSTDAMFRTRRGAAQFLDTL